MTKVTPHEDLSEWQVQVSQDGGTVWIHDISGSTVGRFSKRFGLDIHRSVEEQLQGAGQCIYCTHEPPTESDWLLFCGKMRDHFGINVDPQLVQFDKAS